MAHAQHPVQTVATALSQASVDQFKAAANAGEQVVEVVSNAAGQLADGFHLACLVAGELAAFRFVVWWRTSGVQALLQAVQLVACEVLPAPIAQGGLGHVQQLGIFKGGHQQCQVAHWMVANATGRPGALGNQYDRQIRPARLLVDEGLQRCARALAERLFGDDRQPCTFGQARLQVGQVDCAQAIDAGGGE